MRGIDDEEAYFLNEVDELKMKRERERRLEERREVEEVKISFFSVFANCFLDYFKEIICVNFL